MRHHPDIASDDSSREEFARVCEAYEVLSSGELLGGLTTAQQRQQAQSPAGC
jgi:curved DNA-binding protein CbpA